jgi:hypothetical protein
VFRKSLNFREGSFLERIFFWFVSWDLTFAADLSATSRRCLMTVRAFFRLELKTRKVQTSLR